jgi:hypothetical protein
MIMIRRPPEDLQVKELQALLLSQEGNATRRQIGAAALAFAVQKSTKEEDEH